jgi:hypothetical protein
MEALRFRTQWLVFLFVLTLDICLAQASAASTRAEGPQATKAQAQVDFRIVIPERLNMPSPDAPPVRTRRSISRTVEQRQDRTVITVSMP